MDLSLKGDIAVIVGAAQGIGRAIAEAFAAERANVVLLDVSPTVLRASEETRERFHVETLGLIVDAVSLESLVHARDTIEQRLGPCDHLVYAAGAGSGKFGDPFWNLDPTDWRRVLEVNLMGGVNAAHVFAPGMSERRRGTMLFIASVAGQIGSQTDPPYSAAKAALINFAQCAARDLGKSGVRVNCISPGMVKTELNRSVWQAWADLQPVGEKRTYEDWAGEKIGRVSPMGRWQEPEEMAALAVYLASPLGRNITGQTLNVDGGQVMHS